MGFYFPGFSSIFHCSVPDLGVTCSPEHGLTNQDFGNDSVNNLKKNKKNEI
jgi:hypothetical protein